PTRGRFLAACPRAASGHAAVAPPSTVMNVRRLIQLPRRRGRAERYPQIGDMIREHIYFPIPWIGRHLCPDPVRKREFLASVSYFNSRQYHAIQKSFVDVDVPIVALMRYEVSNLIKDITVTHCAQHFLGVRVGNGILELSANRAAPSTFERYRCYVVCDTHPSFMAFVVRYQPITNPDTSDDGGFPALVSN